MSKHRLKNLFFQISRFFVLLPFLICACTSQSSHHKDNSTLSRIKRFGTLRIITQHNPPSYYKYRGKPIGFEYELARIFARSLGVRLEVIEAGSWDDMIKHLGQSHLIASNVSPSFALREAVDFSNSYLAVQQLLICHKDGPKIESVYDLEGKTVHVPQDSAYEDRLRELLNEGLNFTIKTYPHLTTEELIRKVAQKEIELTLATSPVAFLHRRYYPDLEIGPAIKDNQEIAWAVPKGDHELLAEINRFIADLKENGTINKLLDRYYQGIEYFDYVELKRFHARLKTRLPRFIPIIKTASKKYRLDWRLVTAQIYQESHFDPEAESFTGVRGIMQVTIPTAQLMGIDDRLDPEQSILAGVKYLRYLYDYFSSLEDQDRIFISLAAYNVGPGHIEDAQEIARQMNLNPNRWSSLRKTLPLLSKAKYFNQAKHGYCRGYEPVEYVNKILTYYDILKQKGSESTRVASQENAPPPSEG